MAPLSALSLRANGKNWHETKKPFRTLPGAGKTITQSALPPKQSASYLARDKQRIATTATKARVTEMKAEKKELKEETIRKIKDKREKKVERERWEKLQEKLHKKVVERRRRREKRRSALEGKKVNKTWWTGCHRRLGYVVDGIIVCRIPHGWYDYISQQDSWLARPTLRFIGSFRWRKTSLIYSLPAQDMQLCRSWYWRWTRLRL